MLLFDIHDFASNGARRIRNGLDITTDKPYVVYFVKAPVSQKKYDYWLCGGALVSKEFIITSAACVDDVEFLYAIAGYNKYVIDKEIDTDECTKTNKKKVVYTCTPVSFELQYDKLEKWSYIDIALAKVESPYDLTTIKRGCSYIPTIIPVNYEKKYQESGTDAMVLGWGHLKEWRKPEDSSNYNQQNLKYAPCLVANKEECKKKYEAFPNMTRVIDEYMICTIGSGNINDQGETILKSAPTAVGCAPDQQKLSGLPGTSCEYDEYDDYNADNDTIIDHTRRNMSEAIKAYNESMMRVLANNKKNTNTTSHEYNISMRNEFSNNSNLRTKNTFKDQVNQRASEVNNKLMDEEITNHPIYKIKEFYKDEVKNSSSKVYNTSMENNFSNHSILKIKKFYKVNETGNRVYESKNNKFSNHAILRNRSRGVGRNLATNGICQNDHGGPLVTWVGAHEVLIGVASVFKVSPQSECEGPYLYTSTQCNGAFLDCVLSNSRSLPNGRAIYRSASQALCDSPPKLRGYDTVERHISWMHHPAGPADNEKPKTKYDKSDKSLNEQDKPIKLHTGKLRGTHKHARHRLEEKHSAQTTRPTTVSTKTKKSYVHLRPVIEDDEKLIVRPLRPLRPPS